MFVFDGFDLIINLLFKNWMLMCLFVNKLVVNLIWFLFIINIVLNFKLLLFGYIIQIIR